MFKKILFLFNSFFLPLFIKKKDYNLIILRYDSQKCMFNTKVFFEYLLENSDLNVKYIINDDKLRKELTVKYGDHFITQKTLKDIVLIAKAGTWITDGGFPLKTPFGHKNRVLINLWHGMPIKYVGIKGYKGIQKIRVWTQLKMYAKYYDAFCVTSKEFIPIIKESFLLDESKIKILGQPRNDLLFKDNNRKEILNNLYSNLPSYKKIILYAPTYRDNSFGNKGLEPTRFFPFNDLNLEELEKFLEKNQYIIFIRSHHLDKVSFYETKRIRFLNSDKISEIYEILNIFDLLISDYSGMIIDYLLLKKPVVLLPYDLNVYLQYIGLYFDYEYFYKTSPKIKTQQQFQEEVYKLLNNYKYYSKERESLKNKLFDVAKENNEKTKKFLIDKIKEYKNG
jgi:CDP-glycerol glycerophosphotransferase